MSDDIEVMVEGSKTNQKLVEVDAEVIALIIRRITGVSADLAIRTANAICDYLARCAIDPYARRYNARPIE